MADIKSQFVGFDLDSGAGVHLVTGINIRMSASGGSIEAIGQKVMASSIPVTISSDQSNVNVVVASALPTGSNVIGHVIIDSGSTTVVTGNVSVVGTAAVGATASGNPVYNGGVFNTTPATITNGQIGAIQLDATQNLLTKINVALPTGSNVIGHVVLDSGSTTAITANSSVNVAQINGVTTLMGNGVTGTGSQRVTIASDNTAFSVNATLLTGANVIGHVIADTGSTTVVTGTVTVAGGKTNNNAAPGATNVGVLPALANASTPSWTEGNEVSLSVDLGGNLRVSGSFSAPAASSPVNTYVTSAAVGSGSSVNVDTGTLAGAAVTIKLSQVEVWSSVAYKAFLYTIINNAASANPIAVGGGSAGSTLVLKAPTPNYFSITGVGTVNGYRIAFTNLDDISSADAFATFHTES